MDYIKESLRPSLEDFQQKPTVENVTQILKEFGVNDPEYWADMEINKEEAAVLATFRFLRPLQEDLDTYLYDHTNWVQRALENEDPYQWESIMKEMVQAGISTEKIGLFAYWIARLAFNSVLHRLADAEGGDYDLPNEGEGLPTWCLQECPKDSKDPAYYKKRSLMEMHNIFLFHNPGEK